MYGHHRPNIPKPGSPGIFYLPKAPGVAERRCLPTIVMKIGAPVNSGNIPGHYPALHLQAGHQSICRPLFYTKELPYLFYADTAVFRHVIQHLLLLRRGFVARKRKPPVHQFPVQANCGKASLAAQKEFAVHYFSALDAVNLPVPRRAGDILLGIKPVLGRSHFLYGVARDDVFKERYYAVCAHGIKHSLGTCDPGRNQISCVTANRHLLQRYQKSLMFV